jgi:hypothetical protein
MFDYEMFEHKLIIRYYILMCSRKCIKEYLPIDEKKFRFHILLKKGRHMIAFWQCFFVHFIYHVISHKLPIPIKFQMGFKFCWNFMKLLVYKLIGKSHLYMYLGRCHNCSLTRPIIFGTSQIKQEYNYCKRLSFNRWTERVQYFFPQIL